MPNVNIFVTINMYLKIFLANLSSFMSMCRLLLSMYNMLYVVFDIFVMFFEGCN
jgi:hypothetical protein